MDLHFHSDQCKNHVFPDRNMLLFHVNVNIKWLGICYKDDTFKWLRVYFLLRDNNFKHGALSELTLLGCFHSLRAVLHTAWKIIFIIGALIKLLFQCIFKWYYRKETNMLQHFCFIILVLTLYLNFGLSLVHKRLWVAVVLYVWVWSRCAASVWMDVFVHRMASF